MFSLIALLVSYRRDLAAAQRATATARAIAARPVVANDAAGAFARAA